MVIKSTDLSVSLVAIARTTFDMELARQLSDQVRANLSGIGISLTEPEAFVSELGEAKIISHELAEDPPDLLVLLQATFADSTLAVQLARNTESHVLLWGLPEALTGDLLPRIIRLPCSLSEPLPVPGVFGGSYAERALAGWVKTPPVLIPANLTERRLRLISGWKSSRSTWIGCFN